MTWIKDNLAASMIIALLVVASITAGLTWHFARQSVLQPVESTASSLPVSANPVQPTKAAPPITLKGSGQTATEKFKLIPGLTTFKLTHDGTSNFIVSLLDASGNDDFGSLVNTIGSFNGSTALQITKAGDYLLDIKADGNWTATIQQ
jgi:hypothetical protein